MKLRILITLVLIAFWAGGVLRLRSIEREIAQANAESLDLDLYYLRGNAIGWWSMQHYETDASGQHIVRIFDQSGFGRHMISHRNR